MEKFVRALNEKKEAYITVTGSSSKLLSEQLATVLSGRQIYFHILPLDFKEFLNFHNPDVSSPKEIILNSERIRQLFREYLLWGGFPEVALSKDEEFKRRVLVGYYEDIIGRDVAKRFRVKKVDRVKFLAHFYLTNISSYISFNKVARFTALPVETIRRFSSYIETANLLFFIKRFSFTLKEQENSPRKVYSIDTGLSNAVGFRFSQNYGRLAENIVALSLQRIALDNPFVEVYYWKDRRSTKEIDFLIKEKTKVKSLIQVSWDIEGFVTKEREINSLLKGLNEFGLKEGLIITEDYEKEEKVSGKTIRYLPLWKWMLIKDL